MKKIPLSKGLFALVDDEDFLEVSKYKWYKTSHGYAFNRRNSLYMHRLIMGDTDLQVDHVNFNKLDNRKENLRLVTSRQQSLHRPTNSNNTTGKKGVSFCKQHSKYEAYIWDNRRKVSLGHFIDLATAYEARVKAEHELYGEFA